MSRSPHQACRPELPRTLCLPLLAAALVATALNLAPASARAQQTGVGPAKPACPPAGSPLGGAAAPEPAPCAEPASGRGEPGSDPEAHEGSPAEPAVPAGTRIGDIAIVPHGIFDPSEPGEDKRVFRWADRLHRTTRPKVIERQLLFQSGDVYSQEAVEESERVLRANRYLYDAEIRPVRYGDGRVDLEVVTRDVWTLRAGVSWNRAGGENTTNFTLEDSNFLGTGKDLTVWRISNVDRTSTLLRYRDPHLYGQHLQLEASYAEYSDGGARRFELERPFYALDARWAAGLKLWRYDRVDSLYDRGEVFQRFDHDHDFFEVYAGLSGGLAAGSARRVRIGFTREEDLFNYSPGGDSTPEPPRGRNLSYPWVAFEYVEDGFVVERDLDRIQRTEDLNLGEQLQIRLGWSSPAFGGDANQLLLAAAATAGWRPGDGQLLLASAQGGTRWGKAGTENLLAGAGLRYYRRNFGRHLFYAGADAHFARRLDPETQLLIGGDSGLRGYPLRFQSGDRRFLVTLEQRFFSERELFHLVHLGSAVFFDAGRSWFEEAPDGMPKNELLRDVGVGLRLGSSRSSSGAMVHFDLAYPLDGDDSIDKVQWLVRTSEKF